MILQSNNKIKEAVELFWKENGVKTGPNSITSYSLTWEQKLYNKKRAEEILNKCTKDELIDYILYNGRTNQMSQVSVNNNRNTNKKIL